MTVSRGSRRDTGAGRTAAPPSAGAVDIALTLCCKNQISLTPGRRRILEILAREGRPLGAYEMIDRVAETTGKRPAPISVYRALDFLVEHGYVHRLASRNAFLACAHRHAAHDPVAFLICDNCGRVDEASSPALSQSLGEVAGSAGFTPRAEVIEIAGRCSRCRQAPA